MQRRPPAQSDTPGHDSFLDVVANIVGILIILILVVGVRVKNSPIVAAIPERSAKIKEELENDLKTERSLIADSHRVADSIRQVQQETILQDQQRGILASIVAVGEQDIEQRRRQMDARRQKDFDLLRNISEWRFELDQLKRKRVQLEAADAAPMRIESYPTPKSVTVDDHEAHFQLNHGEITYIPLDELVDLLKADLRRQSYKLMSLPEISGTVGPIGGFRLKYLFRRYDVSAESAMAGGRTGSYARLERWTLVPTASEMGETVDFALEENSDFRQALARLHPGRHTITVWTYPDSFTSFRKIKKELYRLGYSAAARPLPHGVPISGSPHGSKSAAQ